MSLPRKLSDSNERTVALEYLCGVPVTYINEEWDVSKATIEHSILGNRSNYWNDPLVNFYKQNRNEKKSHKNGIHMIVGKLPSHSGISVESADLLENESNEVYNSLRLSVLEPKVEKFIADTNLIKILIGNDRARKTGQEKFLDSLNPSKLNGYYDNRSKQIKIDFHTLDELIYKPLLQELKLAYGRDSTTFEKALDTSFENVKNELLKSCYFGILNNFRIENNANNSFADSILNKLKKDPNEKIVNKKFKREVISDYFGFNTWPKSIYESADKKGFNRFWYGKQKEKIFRQLKKIVKELT